MIYNNTMMQKKIYFQMLQKTLMTYFGFCVCLTIASTAYLMFKGLFPINPLPHVVDEKQCTRIKAPPLSG